MFIECLNVHLIINYILFFNFKQEFLKSKPELREIDRPNLKQSCQVSTPIQFSVFIIVNILNLTIQVSIMLYCYCYMDIHF